MLKEPAIRSRSRLTPSVPVRKSRPEESGENRTQQASPEQHSLPRSIVLHLLPGTALFGFVLVAAALSVPAILALLVGIALVVVPIELGYLLHRGHLLPRIDRFGRGAPVLNAVLFSLYHFWTPWQNIGRILGLIPWIYTVWRKRSVALSMAVHISVNCIFLLLLLAAVTAD